jgi:hypothetical protein
MAGMRGMLGYIFVMLKEVRMWVSGMVNCDSFSLRWRVLDLEVFFYGDGGEDMCEVFGDGGGDGVVARDNGAEGVLALVISGFMDFWLSLHAGGDFPSGVELAVDVEGEVGFDGEKGFDEGFLILLGGVCGEFEVGGVI